MSVEDAMAHMPEYDEMHLVDYVVAKAASQIVYGTKLSRATTVLLHAAGGHVQRSTDYACQLIASVIHAELDAGDELPETVLARTAVADVSAAVLRALLRVCYTTPALRVPLGLHVPYCWALWQAWLADFSDRRLYRDLQTMFREAYPASRVGSSWHPLADRRPDALFAVLQRITGGGLRIGTAPRHTGAALDVLKTWRIGPAGGGGGPAVLGRISVCLACLVPCNTREMPACCFKCGTQSVVFFSSQTHMLLDMFPRETHCCIGGHIIQHDELARGQLGDGYAICDEHNAKFPWLRAIADIRVGVSIAANMQRWTTVISRRTSCYAKRVMRKH